MRFGPDGLAVILALSFAAAVASPIGGLIAIWTRPSTLLMSGALGFAGGVLFATITFEMLPSALELSSLLLTIAGFAGGFGLVYGFDLFIHRGVVAGEKAEQYPRVTQFYKRHRPRGTKVTVLAGGTTVEELIEGLSIGIGFAIRPGVGLLVALAIVVDNVSEALSIGEIIRNEKDRHGRSKARRILIWTSAIGASVLLSSIAGWFFLRGLPRPAFGALFAAGAGGLFYLTVTDLVPEAEERQYQQLPAISMGIGFIAIFALSTFF
jgi:zinc transporter, ZIP family